MGLLRENPAMYPLLPLYNSFLSACVQNESVNYANNCLELMEHQTVGNNEITYALLLKVCEKMLYVSFLVLIMSNSQFHLLIGMAKCD